jgi:hypothetical protein
MDAAQGRQLLSVEHIASNAIYLFFELFTEFQLFMLFAQNYSRPIGCVPGFETVN